MLIFQQPTNASTVHSGSCCTEGLVIVNFAFQFIDQFNASMPCITYKRGFVQLNDATCLLQRVCCLTVCDCRIAASCDWYKVLLKIVHQ